MLYPNLRLLHSPRTGLGLISRYKKHILAKRAVGERGEAFHLAQPQGRYEGYQTLGKLISGCEGDSKEYRLQLQPIFLSATYNKWRTSCVEMIRECSSIILNSWWGKQGISSRSAFAMRTRDYCKTKISVSQRWAKFFHCTPALPPSFHSRPPSPTEKWDQQREMEQ